MDLDAKPKKEDELNGPLDDSTGTVTEDAGFLFPFKPYDIQLQLMKVAHETYERSKFAILESPTGTGKSLSLICSSLTWLREHQAKVKASLEEEKASVVDKIDAVKREEDESGDWLSAQTKRQDLTRELKDLDAKLDKIIKVEQRNDARRHAKLHNNPLENYAAFATGTKVNSNTHTLDSSVCVDPNNESIISCQEGTDDKEEEEIENVVEQQDIENLRPKIYFASRTHSQLSQFVNEVKRTKFADLNLNNPIKVAPLASRANLCVNMDVLRLKDPSAINEKCMEMQKENNKEKRCPFAKANQISQLKEEILSSVQDIEDIVTKGRTMGSCAYYAARMAVPEAELVVLPYNNLLHHETRKASSLDLNESVVIIDEAHNILETICSIHSAVISGQQLIASHTILSRYYARYYNRMNPKNSIIIKSIVQCITALIRYLDKPNRHLKDYDCPKSVHIDEEEDFLAKAVEGDIQKVVVKQEELMIDVAKFIGAANIEQFNIFRLIDYFNRSQLARKLLGFFRHDTSLDLSLELCGLTRQDEVASGEKTKVPEGGTKDSPSIKQPKKKRKTLSGQQIVDQKRASIASQHKKSELTSLDFLKESNPKLKTSEARILSYPIYTLVEFLRSLTNLSHDGKVLTHHVPGDIQQSTLKFILLNPSSQFKQMAQEARSVVLAGGTMQPFSEFVDLLFSPLGIDENRLTLFSCGHVVDPKQVYISTLSNGCTGKSLELSFKTRGSFEVIDEIGRTIASLASVTPGGMVCFLPSYDYEQICFTRWTKMGTIRIIETKSKQVFREPRQASQLKPVLEEYSRAIEKGRERNRGALLFCVVGGKMSEGINFNDDLGRCIVMVGLPYANIKSAELQQKMSYYDRTCKRPGNSGQLNAGQQYYENLCIKGVNQSIGRAIRHRADYAAIILLDRRYACKNSIKNALPGWLRESLVLNERFGPLFSQVKSFFGDKTPARC